MSDERRNWEEGSGEERSAGDRQQSTEGKSIVIGQYVLRPLKGATCSGISGSEILLIRGPHFSPFLCAKPVLCIYLCNLREKLVRVTLSFRGGGGWHNKSPVETGLAYQN
ncbi:hypothetical protein SY85_10255 [Flavisolibacter tropicus]|uniref:Uncharacterized protein n=1 Tax=Flavisolibacter tropicus TaxID=1492898 RepID=A0A172TV01_9BACT|nr:hypothetical protein SY85_10255 [Flavisolibacter tropicus]